MPRIRTLDKKRRPPAGYELIEATLEELNARMREAEREPHEGKRKCEPLWPIFRIHHQRSRYIYDMFYKRKAISKELYEWCLREKIADKDLIAKWKKSGYERLCCLRCIQTDSTAFGSACICRVPKKDLEENKLIECVLCGCRGCASESSKPKTSSANPQLEPPTSQPAASQPPTDYSLVSQPAHSPTIPPPPVNETSEPEPNELAPVDEAVPAIPEPSVAPY
eukprot:Protomagalhaensia_sp_Gyna_25__3369@NODE_3041_length_759_cov_255_450000_g2543_i0_p1_GENE_NODE_3041_length_759_cov_255_450000_g2543_i0NODE_3041_length_759_cov_255_450000_g2543_i0_p1_ORF_typecomplete_len223_score32_51G10/PF01125_17/9_2e69_NODE_3041_length_759_cov_255_450000_g2543_i045713